MTPLLAQVIMGWPAIMSSLLVSVIGIVSKRPAFLVAGAVLCLGFAWYLRAWPLLLPHAGIAAYLGAVVLSQ